MKLSIITINYNNASDLKKTIASVFNQTWQEFEYIIIDGGSSDGSTEVIKEIEHRTSYWVSEKDRGVFHAMNKGIEKARGEYLLMMNAGDLFSDNDVLNRVFAGNEYNEDLIYGDVYRSRDGEVFEESIFPDKLTFDFFRKGSLSHQATFIKSDLHKLVGLYDENLKFSADLQFFMLAVCKHNVSYRHIPFFIAICDCTGLTCNPSNFPAMKQETDNMAKLHFPAFIDDYLEFDQYKNKALKVRASSAWRSVKKGIKRVVLKR